MRMYSNLLVGNCLAQRQQLPSMLNVACCDAGCWSEEEVVLVFVSAITTTVCGSFVGVIGGGGISLTGFGFMLVVVCIVSNEQRTVVADEVFLCVIFLRAGRDETRRV